MSSFHHHSFHFIIHNQSIRSFTAVGGGRNRGTIKRGLCTERARLGTFRGFGSERAILGTLRKISKKWCFLTQKEQKPGQNLKFRMKNEKPSYLH